MPAYELALSDVNPPVHAWACWRVYKMTAPRGERDVAFLKRVFTKLLLNFTWWVNRKDVAGNHLFAGGFLGLDNIGVFDRSKPLPGGGRLEQADGTAWMAFYASTMLAMALELAQYDDTYEDIASKFFEHFVHIADAMNTLGGMGLWHEGDGFYYDQLKVDETSRAAGRFARSSGSSRCSPSRCWSRPTSIACQASASGWSGSSSIDPIWDGISPTAIARTIAKDRRRRTNGRPPATGCWRFRRGSGWNECYATSSTKANSCRRTACGRCRAFIATTPSCCGPMVRNTASTTRPASPHPACLAAIPIGEGRSGSP